MGEDRFDEEASRLWELRRHEIMDTPPEASFSDVAFLASTVCETPIALISLLDDRRQWFKACLGLNVTETAREIAFCNYVVKDRQALVVEDATLDPRFKDNPLVVGEPFIRFYAGVPLMSGSHILGTLCIIDTRPRSLERQHRRILEALARQVMNQLELRMTLKELRHLQGELKEENQKYSSLVDHLRDAVFQTDMNGAWSFLSPAWEQMLGYSISECLGNLFTDHIVPEDRLTSLRIFESLTTHRQDSCRHVIRFAAKDGRIRQLEASVRMMFDQDGNPLGSTGTLSDVTDQKAQDTLIEQQRIKMIQSARLYSLGEMAAGIAHEINNPLAIIRGSAQLLGQALQRQTLSVDIVQDSVVKIDSTVGRISKIIAGLRSFARDGGRDPYSEVPVISLISDALELCQTRFKNSGIHLDLENHLGEANVECRPTQIAQVLLNLLNNAFDAVAAREDKRIYIRIVESGDDVEISVRDSGPGVPEELKEKIMEPFFSTKGPNRGMGLGLSLSKGLVESHHGALTYERSDGFSCFKIRLPKKQQLQEAANF